MYAYHVCETQDAGTRPGGARLYCGTPEMIAKQVRARIRCTRMLKSPGPVPVRIYLGLRLFCCQRCHV